MHPRHLRAVVVAGDAMNEITATAEDAPIATTTRVPRETSEADDESGGEAENAPTTPATRIP
jgi:hypothetical protein